MTNAYPQGLWEPRDLRQRSLTLAGVLTVLHCARLAFFGYVETTISTRATGPLSFNIRDSSQSSFYRPLTLHQEIHRNALADLILSSSSAKHLAQQQAGWWWWKGLCHSFWSPCTSKEFPLLRSYHIPRSLLPMEKSLKGERSKIRGQRLKGGKKNPGLRNRRKRLTQHF